MNSIENYMKQENNVVTITGTVCSSFKFSHEIFGEGFYFIDVMVNRISDAVDTIPVLVSERMVDVSQDPVGAKVKITGQIRTYNRQESECRRLIISVFAKEISNLDEEESDNKSINQVSLIGHICKAPVYRKTPLGRDIADMLLAVNRPYGKSDYIPCICWGRNAMFAGNLYVGAHIKIDGRIQSRLYRKTLPDCKEVERTAIEVSVSKIRAVGGTDEKN